MESQVNVTRDGRWWMVEVPAIGGLTQARRLADVEPMARSYIATDQDLPLPAVKVKAVNIAVAAVDIGALAEEVSVLREEAARAERAAASRMRSAAKELTEAGVPVRDIGDALGVSHQRVSQLVREG